MKYRPSNSESSTICLCYFRHSDSNSCEGIPFLIYLFPFFKIMINYSKKKKFARLDIIKILLEMNHVQLVLVILQLC